MLKLKNRVQKLANITHQALTLIALPMVYIEALMWERASFHKKNSLYLFLFTSAVIYLFFGDWVLIVVLASLAFIRLYPMRYVGSHIKIIDEALIAPSWILSDSYLNSGSRTLPYFMIFESIIIRPLFFLLLILAVQYVYTLYLEVFGQHKQTILGSFNKDLLNFYLSMIESLIAFKVAIIVMIKNLYFIKSTYRDYSNYSALIRRAKQGIVIDLMGKEKTLSQLTPSPITIKRNFTLWQDIQFYLMREFTPNFNDKRQEEIGKKQVAE